MSDVYVYFFLRNYLCYSNHVNITHGKTFLNFFSIFSKLYVHSIAFVFPRRSSWDREGVGWWKFISENCHFEGNFRDSSFSEVIVVLKRGNSFWTSYATRRSPLGRHVKWVKFCGKCWKAHQLLIHLQPEHLSRATQLWAIYNILMQ